jgi:mRNA-degrading endonuclease toxin of MazEF toxin-antitoxin module
MPSRDWIPLPGHIVHAQIQYTDVEGSKSRFPVVVSSEGFNQSHHEIVVAFTTRSMNVHAPQDYDVEISDRHPDFAQTGLTERTTVRCGRLWTLNKRAISNVVGIVPDDLMVDISRLVLRCF